jgi:DNA-binding SARP family transcriptional activator
MQYDAASATTQNRPGLVVVRFFWRFTCEIDGQPIVWLRRMDRRIFQYLALAPNGRVTREELCSVFWDGSDPKAAHLSLRTACSNIRKAIGSVAGTQSVERYFSSADDALSVNLEQIHVDVRRFIGHMRNGNTCYASDESIAASGHYKRALRLYAGHIGWGDEPETWLEPLAAECAALHRTAIERLAAIAYAQGLVEQAHEYEGILARTTERVPSTA